MAYAVGHILSPAPRADFFNKLLPQDARWPFCFGVELGGRVQERRLM
jgi:hypothetical protein